MNKHKLRDAKRLLGAKVYVLITEDETSLQGDFSTTMDEAMKIAIMTSVRDQLNELLKQTKPAKKNKKTK